MIKEDSDSLECDLAEYYHIYDMRELPLQRVALFSCGLREDSRIMTRLRGDKIPFSTFLLSGILDRLSLLWWSKTEDGQRNQNIPTLITNVLNGKETEKGSEIYFSSGEEFETYRKFLLEREEY